MKEVNVLIWEGLVDKIEAPEGVKVIVRDYDSNCDCGECLKDDDGDQYHEHIQIGDEHSIKP